MDGREVRGEDVGEFRALEMVFVWPRRPKMPGSRWPKGRIALNMCVTIVAPACKAACACSRVASECPIE